MVSFFALKMGTLRVFLRGLDLFVGVLFLILFGASALFRPGYFLLRSARPPTCDMEDFISMRSSLFLGFFAYPLFRWIPRTLPGVPNGKTVASIMLES